jgi:hypothetical protein
MFICRLITAVTQCGLLGHRRWSALLLATGALVLAMAGPAAAAPIPIALNATNWSGSAGFGSSSPGWYEDSLGIIHLTGAARQISFRPPLEIVLGTLPAAARPARDVFTIVHTFNGTYADLEIETNGTIAVIGPPSPAVEDLSFVSLESISYQPVNTIPASAIALNGANWSSRTGFGTDAGAPAAYRTGGVVRLEGAAKQISSLGPRETRMLDQRASNRFSIRSIGRSTPLRREALSTPVTAADRAARPGTSPDSSCRPGERHPQSFRLSPVQPGRARRPLLPGR